MGVINKIKRRIITNVVNNINVSNVKGGLIYKVSSQSLIDMTFPVHLFLEISNLCNLTCPWCTIGKTERVKKFMPLKLVQKIADEAAKHGATGYSLHMFGEPLMHPKWECIIKVIKRAHPHNKVLLTTNGKLIDKNVCETIERIGVDKVFMSVTPYVDYTKKLHIASNIFKRTKLVARTYNDEDIVGVDVEKREYHNFSDENNRWSGIRLPADRHPCWRLWYTLGVTPDGAVTICCADYRLGLILGNVNHESLGSMWRGDKVRTIREEHFANKFEVAKVCEQCDAWGVRPNIFFGGQR